MEINSKILKFICAAGNEDIEEIEKLSYVFASAGFNMIDTAADVNAVYAVKKGIDKAKQNKKINICVSIGLKEDIHFSKALINNEKCIKCKKCLDVCERNAIKEIDNKLVVDEKKCIGCQKCINICNVQNAISYKNKSATPLEMLTPLLNEKIDCVEFHCTSENEKLILDCWNDIKSIYKGQLSICLNRAKLGDEKIINLLNKMIENLNDVIIQADGKPMTGSINDFKSNLETVAFANLIRKANIHSKLILSGGTNAKTSQFAKMCDVDIDGAAFGSYARKIVNEYINNPNFWNDIEVQKQAIKTAKKFASEILKYW